MARKKKAETAVLKASPVLRSDDGGGGDDPTPETPVITKSYIMRDDWIDKGIGNIVAFKSVDGEVQDLLINGEPAGGGGGDFSTCTLTVINNIVNAVWPSLHAPALQYVPPVHGNPEFNYLGSYDILYDEGINTFEVVLYKGAACVEIMGDIDVGIVWSENHFNDPISYITGDTTVTLTDAE